jgi:hypothetical protein
MPSVALSTSVTTTVSVAWRGEIATSAAENRFSMRGAVCKVGGAQYEVIGFVALMWCEPDVACASQHS